MSDWFPSSGISYAQYMQAKSFSQDIEQAQREATRETVTAIDRVTLELIEGIDRGSRLQGDALRQQTSALERAADLAIEHADRNALEIADKLDDVSYSVDELNASFRWGFAQMLAGLGGVADSLASLVRIARTPAQTAAYEQFEIARDAFRRELFEECLESLEKAIRGDHTSPGYRLEWRFHQLEGVVRLGSAGRRDTLCDPARAESSFLLAARYARTDAPKEAARAMLSAGWAAFVQDKRAEALAHTEAATQLDDRLGEAFFQTGKIRMSMNDPSTALPSLRKAIACDPAYVLKASGDGEYQRFENDLRHFLTGLRDETARDIRPRVESIMPQIEPWLPKPDVAEHPVVQRWRILLDGDSDPGLMLLLTCQHRFDTDRDLVAELVAQTKANHERSVEEAKLQAQREEEQRAKDRRDAEAKCLRDENRKSAAREQVAALASFLRSAETLECDYPPFGKWQSELRSRPECVEASRTPEPNTPLESLVLVGVEAQQVLAALRAERMAIEKGLIQEAVALCGELQALYGHHYSGVRFVIEHRLAAGVIHLGSLLGLPAITPTQKAERLVDAWLARHDILRGFAERLLPAGAAGIEGVLRAYKNAVEDQSARDAVIAMRRDLEAGTFLQYKT